MSKATARPWLARRINDQDKPFAIIGNQTDAKIDDLVGYFLGELYKPWPPSPEEAEADQRTLRAQLHATIDDWVFAKYDGEREA